MSTSTAVSELSFRQNYKVHGDRAARLFAKPLYAASAAMLTVIVAWPSDLPAVTLVPNCCQSGITLRDVATIAAEFPAAGATRLSMWKTGKWTQTPGKTAVLFETRQYEEWIADVTASRVINPASTVWFRIVGAAIIDDVVIVANGGTNELLFFDTAGTALYSRGREGSGPAEFRGLAWMKPCQSGIATWDEGNGRIVWWSAKGAITRSWNVPGAPPGRTRVPVGVLGNCKPAVSLGRTFDRPPAGVFSPPHSIVVMDPGPSIPAGPAVFEQGGRRVFVHQHSQGPSVTPMPFQPVPFILTRADEFIVGDGERLEYAVIDENGRQRQVVKAPDYRPVPLPRDSISAYRERRVRRAPEPVKRIVSEATAAMPMPQEVPAVQQSLVDALGNVWLQEGGLDSQSRWVVFDRQGSRIAQVRIPRKYQVVAASDNLVVAVHKDENDEEHVAFVPLRKTGAR